MKHRHEIETGQTSTATHHLMGFNATGKPVQGRDSVRSKIKGIDEIAKESYKVVTLMDLAGHEKFLKTTYVWRVVLAVREKEEEYNSGVSHAFLYFYDFSSVSMGSPLGLRITRLCW